MMRPDEANTFLKYIKNCKNYLEFGSGGSTIFALKYSSANVVSIEGSQEWYNKMCNDFDIIKQSKKNGRLTFIYENIGKTKEASYPLENDYLGFENYSSAFYKNIKTAPNVILIDGRFRVACTLFCISKFKNATFMIHDFWSRDQYHIVLQYFDVLEKVDNLGVFKVKENVKIDDVLKDYELYKYEII